MLQTGSHRCLSEHAPELQEPPKWSAQVVLYVCNRANHITYHIAVVSMLGSMLSTSIGACKRSEHVLITFLRMESREGV